MITKTLYSLNDFNIIFELTIGSHQWPKTPSTY